MDVQKETEFFHDIAAQVRQLVVDMRGRASVATYKVLGDYATEVDIAVEKLIVAEIDKRWPGDAVLAEEAYSDTPIGDSRIWIIDPICGTANIGRGLTNFCTNIALADKGELIAACVVDHTQNDYFWSTGGKQVYTNNTLYTPLETDEQFGKMIDVDLGSIGMVPKAEQRIHADTMYRLSLEPSFALESLNSSLSFAYAAVGKFDAFINILNHPWDICAASFLVQQAGGVITDLAGEPWTLTSVGAIAASTPELHAALVAARNGK